MSRVSSASLLVVLCTLAHACASNTEGPIPRRDAGRLRDTGPIGGDEDAGPIGGDDDAGPIGGDEDAGPVETDAGMCATEVCNGRDDDCDSMIDDGFAIGTPCSVGVGDCATDGTNVCSPDGTGVECDALPGTPGTETCDGLDNDCDGSADEMLGMTSCGMGSCMRTVAACVDGRPVTCTPGDPCGEVCNGADDDCDGMTDEMLGTMTCGMGACMRTVESCVGGMPQTCTPGTGSAEVCNGTDDDCNGTVDDRAPITCGVGACMRTVPGCTGGMTSTCTPGTGAATDACPANGVDDDCNGTADEDCPSNDARTSAIAVTLGATETTVTGTTAGATHDGPMPCGCTSGANVWYRFTLATAGVVYLDTQGTGFDTSLFLTDAAGAALPAQAGNGQPNAGLCNDDNLTCSGVSGFTATESRTWGYLAPGTYYVAVGGCAVGAFTLHLQYLASNVGSFFYSTRLTGTGTPSTVLVGASASTSACGGTASGEDVRWIVSCGSRQFFSLCRSDGASFQRREGAVGTTLYDPSLYLRSAQSGAEVMCNDDGMGMGGTDCRGYLGTDMAALDTLHYGSRLNNVLVPRGLSAVFVDGRVGSSGMDYALRHVVAD